MTTPIYDFLVNYAKKNPTRLHMPGHKGRLSPPLLKDAVRLDITEIEGADSLFEADGIIAQSEENAAKLYGSSATFYSCAGSTLCIQTMLLLMKQEGRAIIAARNVHRAFLEAAALLDLTIYWVYPQKGEGVLSGTYNPDDFKAILESLHRPACIYLTSPDYLGKMADIARFSALCKTYCARLLVDNAHGAHLAFLPYRYHPISLGADMCCDSAHKMISGLTGTAYLHVHSDNDVDKTRIRTAMAMFASTSPSYLLLASLDWCNRELDSPLFRRGLYENSQHALQIRRQYGNIFHFPDTEPLHLTINARESGFNGFELRDYLLAHNIFPEYADAYDVVLLLSAATNEDDFTHLETTLSTFTPTTPPPAKRADIPHPETVCSIREAALAPQKTIPVTASLGRICAAVKVPCPPAIPIVLSGERIDAACIETCLSYGITDICVVQ